MDQPTYTAHLLKYKTGFKSVVSYDGFTQTTQWFESEEQARESAERDAFAQHGGALLRWGKTINKIRKSNDEISGE